MKKRIIMETAEGQRDGWTEQGVQIGLVAYGTTTI